MDDRSTITMMHPGCESAEPAPPTIVPKSQTALRIVHFRDSYLLGNQMGVLIECSSTSSSLGCWI